MFEMSNLFPFTVLIKKLKCTKCLRPLYVLRSQRVINLFNKKRFFLVIKLKK